MSCVASGGFSLIGNQGTLCYRSSYVFLPLVAVTRDAKRQLDSCARRGELGRRQRSTRLPTR